MSYRAVDALPRTLEEAIRSDDLDAINVSLSVPGSATRDVLRACLFLAMPDAALPTIELLLQYGATLSSLSFSSAIQRGDPGVFELLVDSGWDIDSTEFGTTAVQ